jgi:predicted nucleic acid-binding protein
VIQKEKSGIDQIFTISKIFIDTNILIYSLDRHAPEKQKQARELLKKAALENSGVISTQVLQEFYVAATRKLGVDPLLAKEMVHAFNNYETVVITLEMIKDAIDCSILQKVSFWDALMLIAGEKALCEMIWTEDLNNGQIIRGIKVINPFI